MHGLSKIFFCHGAPGSPMDAEILEVPGEIIAPNMFDRESGDVSGDLLKVFDQTTASQADGTIHVVGFSIGAMMAIKIAAARPERVGRLTLISPAAPLEMGDFLPHMAGKPIFELAMQRPKMLRALTNVQGALSGVMPNFLLNQVFAKCGEMEKGLLALEPFRKVIKQGFQNSFRQNPNAYIDLLQAYVSDWSADVKNVTCPVEIWHGDKDTWSPISMSHALCSAFPMPPKLHVVQNGEHYSTLAKAVLTT